jgi:hypothetical protein
LADQALVDLLAADDLHVPLKQRIAEDHGWFRIFDAIGLTQLLAPAEGPGATRSTFTTSAGGCEESPCRPRACSRCRWVRT